MAAVAVLVDPAEAPAAAAEPATWSVGRFPGVKPSLVPPAPAQSPSFVDEAALREEKTFPIPAEDLVELAKHFTAMEPCSDKAKMAMADDFRFIAPVVPAMGDGLTREQFCDAFSQFKVAEAFPDLNPQMYDFRTDPFEPNRVWYTSRGEGTNTGPILGQLPATGKSFQGAPQTSSLTFNEAGEVTKMTIGYVMDKTVGNTGGLGGIFGILYSVGYGLPFPEAQPWTPSPFYRLLFLGGNFVRKVRELLVSR